MARLLIAGCGAVGTTLGTLLAGEGWEVWGLRRDPTSLPPTIKPVAADLSVYASLGSLPGNLDVVCYTAAAGGYVEERYIDAYQRGVENLLTALSDQGQSPGRLLFTSSSSVYGEQDGEWVDEDTPVQPGNFAQRALMAGESLLSTASCPGVVVRFGGIYGPGRNALLERVRGGRSTCGASLYSNRIHQLDCARVLAHLITLPKPSALYLAVDQEPAPLCEVMRWLAARLSVPPPRELPVDRDGRGTRSANKRCSSRRLLATGFRFRYPSYREGYAEMLADLQVSSANRNSPQ
jgi:nucleoside-diphosphate-sugar epimerase